MANEEDYYQLLGLGPRQRDEALSAQELKSAYRRALLKHHPDKDSSSNTKSLHKPTVDDIVLAYKTLSTPSLKLEYDRHLRTGVRPSSHATVGETYHIGLETVDLDDLQYDSAAGMWRRECRCGDESGFIVTEAELEKKIDDGELLVGCKGCSLWLRVMFSTEG